LIDVVIGLMLKVWSWHTHCCFVWFRCGFWCLYAWYASHITKLWHAFRFI